MTLDVVRELAALQRMTPKELRAKYAEVFHEVTRTGNKTFLVRRIAWRLQSLAEGGLSARAQKRALELANDADVRLTTPKVMPERPAAELLGRRDARLPKTGNIISRDYKGETIQVIVLPKGFEYQGKTYRSLSAIAQEITGSHWNGYTFFGLKRQGKAS